MKSQQLPIIASCAIAALYFASAASAGTDPTGVWLDDTGRGAVEIKSCGSALCGHVVAVKNATDRKGCGKQIIGDAQPASGGVWDSGWIYSPEKRKTYDVELKPLGDGTLRVVGYAGTKLFSRTMIWRRAPADLERCDVAAVAPKRETQQAAPVAAPPPAPAPQSIAKPQATTASQETAAVQPAAPPAAATAPIKTDFEKTAPAAPAPQVSAPPAVHSPQPAPTAQPPAAPPAAEAQQRADSDANADDSGDAPGQRSKTKRGGINLGDLKLDDIKLDKIIKRTRSGDCKIDLPFVKVQFNCDD